MPNLPNMETMVWSAWGKLVEEWARDESIRPSSVAELNLQMRRASVGVEFSEEFTDVAFCQAKNDHTVQVFLPTVSAIDNARGHLNAGGAYLLPKFYKELAFGNRPANIKQEDKEEMLVSRIGDYAIGQCG